jgi:hypothetical protein
MRNPTIGLLIAALALVACGPSATELKGAKTAHYKGDKLVLFNASKAVTESKYKIAKSDETTLGFQTVGRWYTPEGLVVDREGGSEQRKSGGYDSAYPDLSINILLVVTLLPDGDEWVVKVTPVMERFHAGRPNTDKLSENDPSVPGWATGKADMLAVEIHDALKQYEVKSVPGLVPPPSPTAPPAAPEEPKPAAPSEAPGATPATK